MSAFLDRPVVDPLAGVVREVRRGVDHLAEREVVLVGGEHGAVAEVDPLPRPPLRRGDLGERRRGLLGGVEADVAQPDERPHRGQLDAQAQRVPERAVGVGQAGEEIGVVDGREDLAGAGEDVGLDHRLVRQAVAERRRLDAEPDDRAAEGDGLELRDHERHQPVRERGGDEVLVGRHPGHVRGAGDGVDRQHAVQPVDGEPAAAVAEAEQVRGLLAQPHRGVRGSSASPRRTASTASRCAIPASAPTVIWVPPPGSRGAAYACREPESTGNPMFRTPPEGRSGRSGVVGTVRGARSADQVGDELDPGATGLAAIRDGFRCAGVGPHRDQEQPADHEIDDQQEADQGAQRRHRG